MKTMKYLSMVLLMLVTSACMLSCSDDDEPTDVISTSIVGTWVYESETFSHTYVFNSNLTGREIEVSKDSHGSVTSTYEENFEYSLSSDANGYNYVLIVSESSSTRQRYEITNSRLLLYINSNTYYEYRKQ